MCPVRQQGRMHLVQTLYRQPAAWDLSVPCRVGYLIEEARPGTPTVSEMVGLCSLEGRVRLQSPARRRDRGQWATQEGASYRTWDVCTP